jgi:hypothetical protein
MKRLSKIFKHIYGKKNKTQNAQVLREVEFKKALSRKENQRRRKTLFSIRKPQANPILNLFTQNQEEGTPKWTQSIPTVKVDHAKESMVKRTATIKGKLKKMKLIMCMVSACQ